MTLNAAAFQWLTFSEVRQVPQRPAKSNFCGFPQHVSSKLFLSAKHLLFSDFMTGSTISCRGQTPKSLGKHCPIWHPSGTITNASATTWAAIQEGRTAYLRGRPGRLLPPGSGGGSSRSGAALRVTSRMMYRPGSTPRTRDSSSLSS